MKTDELSLWAEIDFTVDGEPGLITAQGRRITFQIESYKGLYRVLRMAARHLANPRPLFVLHTILRTLEFSLTIKVGRYTFFVLGDKAANGFSVPQEGN